MSERLRLATTVEPGGDVRHALDRAAALESAGVDVIGVPELYGTDAVSLLGYLAAKTQHAQLAAWILPIYSRTPTLIAMTAAGLDEVSGGRFVLGLGASGPQVIEGWHGVRYDAPIARTREIIEICRAVWRRERLEHQGRYYQIPLAPNVGTGLGKPLKLISHPVRSEIPIYLAALGQKNVELAAEIADGWVPFLYIPELADRVWGDALARGHRLRAADLPPLQIAAGGPFAFTDAPVALRDQGRKRLALYLGGMGSEHVNFYNQVAQRYGFEEQAAQVQRRFLAGDRSGAEAAVPAELAEGTSLIGDEAYIRDRLQAFSEAGVTILQVDPIGPHPLEDLRTLRGLLEET
jgi:F420-dependent oxidoreductase-like protein